MQTEVGTLLGGCYKIRGLLGEGGMASVYRATHTATGQEVALKLLRAFDGAPKRLRDALRLFEHEFMTLAQISHPRVVAAYDYAIDPEAGPFYVMELLDGGDLHQRTPLPWREACSVARDVCAALALLHSRRLVYRDLSPKNVRCTTSGLAKLIDFGAMMPFGLPSETVGTPPFIPPEALARLPLDGRADLYALGATLYYGLTGQHAYPARTIAELWDVWRGSPMAPSSYVPNVPEGLDRLVMQLLQHDPAQRPMDAAEVMQRLEATAGLPIDEQLHVAHAYLLAPKLIGRDETLRKLQDARSAALNGRTNAAFITGREGIGRSRLLEESLLHAKVEGFVSLRIEGRDAEDREYGTLSALGEALLRAVPQAVEDTQPEQRAMLAELIPQLRQNDCGGARASLPYPQRHSSIQGAACAWLAAIAHRRPICIGIDDAARVDVPSLAVLASLLRDHPGTAITLLWSASSEERGTADWPLALVLLERASTVVTLPALGPGETEELLSAVFGSVPNVAQLAAYVQHTAIGNPRDTMQLLRHLLSEGVIRHTAGAWSLPARWSASGLPSSMVHALEQRVGKLGRSARLLAFAFAAEPREHFSLEECGTLLRGIDGCDRARDLGQCREAGVIEPVGFGYRLAQLGFATALGRATSDGDKAAQHERLAQLFESRGDDFRAAQHLLRAGEERRALDRLIRASSESERRTDGDMRVYFEEMRALPVDWLTLFQNGVLLCESLKRPAKECDILLSRVAAFIPLTNSSGGGHGFWLLKRRLERLVSEVGLDVYAALPATMDEGTRLKAALEEAKRRYDAKPSEERVFEPLHAIKPLATTMLCALAMTSLTNAVHEQRELPRLGPLVALSPALWVIQQQGDGIGMRLEGRFEAAAHLYRAVLTRMEQPDRAGFQEAERRSSRLRISLSIGTLDACLGLPSAKTIAEMVCSEPDWETQGLMVRHLSELWLGQLGDAAVTRRAIEQRRAFSTIHISFDGQYLLAELSAQSLLGDLTGLRESAEAAKRMADQHPSWDVVVQYCQGEYESCRGDPVASLERLERALDGIGGAGNHQLWANAAGAYVRVLSELGRQAQARELGEHYLAQAEAAGLGYLANYIRIPLSAALACTDMARASVLAERAVDELHALGCRGLNLVMALENRARLALHAHDIETYERFAELSATENSGLSRRLRRAKGGALAARELESDLVTSSVLSNELSSVLAASAEIGERSRRVLRLLSRYTDAKGAACYVCGRGRLERVASVGELPHLEQLDRWAQAYFEGQLRANDASTSQFDALTEIVPTTYGIPSGMYVPRVIGHASTNGYVHTGLIVLAMPLVRDAAGWLTTFTETFSRSFSVYSVCS